MNDSLDLELEDVSIHINGTSLFSPLALRVRAGETAVVMGPSGSGKSTLLALICGTLSPVFSPRGRVTLRGENLLGLPPEKRRIGILFQDDLLFPHMSVGGNLLFALPPGGSRKYRREKGEAALFEAGLEGFFDRDPATLSGGQRARVAVMRTLLSGPGALLLDEPFSRLDVAMRQSFRAFVFEHVRSRRLPALMVTHDPEDARAAGGPVVVIETLSAEDS
ncbi:MAG TPA: ATP-binding cassette domain-containing protein [Desulfomicrobiaceae bacterium]|jgi:putative thiamine transport system ATP-binding protein|nr:ATP-binding cassette domain-containing protein [Desulfomicrobiaceae bacterium]